MKSVNPVRHNGFTLIELLIVVVIIGILAAVAIPAFTSYLTRSKASEVATILQTIRGAEETYYTNQGKRYTDNLPDNPPLDGDCTCTKDARQWDLPADGPWAVLEFDPGGPTYYSYRVTSNFVNGLRTNVLPTAGFADKGTSWPAFPGPWFVAQACGDVDCDGQVANFYISSHNRNVFHEEHEKGVY